MAVYPRRRAVPSPRSSPARTGGNIARASIPRRAPSCCALASACRTNGRSISGSRQRLRARPYPELQRLSVDRHGPVRVALQLLRARQQDEPDLLWTSTSTPASTHSPTPGPHRADQLVRAAEHPETPIRPAGVHERRQPARGPHRSQGSREGDGARARAPNGGAHQQYHLEGRYRGLLSARRPGRHRLDASVGPRSCGTKAGSIPTRSPSTTTVRLTLRSSGSAAMAGSKRPTISGRMPTRASGCPTATTRPRT